MKRFLTLLCSVFMLGYFLPSADAQETNLLGDVLAQLDSTQLENLSQNLSTLNLMDKDTLSSDIYLDGMLDELMDVIAGGGVAIDSTFLEALTIGQDTFNNVFVTALYDAPGDIDTLDYFYGHIDSLFNENYTDLSEVFEENVEDLTVNPVVGLEYYEEDIDSNLVMLTDSVDSTEIITIEGESGIGSLVSGLFNDFGAFEIAFGFQNGVGTYGIGSYDANAKLLRFGSVPSYEQTLGAKWNVSMSWTDSEVVNVEETETVSVTEESGFSPLVLGGEFALIYSPSIFDIGPLNVKLLTSLGVEVSSYAPKHLYYSSYNIINEGYTTGLGPQAGAGFAFTIGNTTTFSNVTTTFGTILNEPSNVSGSTFTSLKFEAGIQYADVIIVRYTKGNQDWTANINRDFNTDSQFTIGLILK